MKKIVAGIGAAVLAVSLTACGNGGYDEEDLCEEYSEQYNSAPAPDAVAAPASFQIKGGGSGARGGSGAGGSKSWGWGNQSKPKSQTNSNSGSTVNKAPVTKTSKGYHFNSKPKFKGRHSGGGFIFIGTDGNEYVLDCD